MITLECRSSDDLISRHSFDKRSIRVGRDCSADIQLIDDTISREHCRIVRMLDGSCKIIDSSTNGTFVNGNKIDAKKITTNDILQIGSWQITLCDCALQEKNNRTILSTARPMEITSFEEKSGELSFNAITLSIITPRRDKERHTFCSQRIGIGSDSGNDVVIMDPAVSATHCEIRLENSKWIITDLKSRNGTRFGDDSIERKELPERGFFSIGNTTIRFRQKQLKERLPGHDSHHYYHMVGKSKAMRQIFSLIDRCANSDATICITGQSGTGKELVARAIHASSRRSDNAFLAINCGAIAANLMESELFGHEKGSFTGTTGRHRGIFEQANNGTLFLDEIGELPLDLQPKLLRVLEESSLRRVGGSEIIPIQVRVVVATHRNLQELVATGAFREDLFYRLFIIPITLPPLAQRREDIPILVEHFIRRFSGDSKRYSHAALNKLCSFNWPGNIRELENTIRRSLLMSSNDVLDEKDILIEKMVERELPESSTLKNIEKQSIIRALKETGGNQLRAAELLQIARSTLTYKLQKFNINVGKLRM